MCGNDHIFVVALVLLRKFKINPILAMVLCGVANVVLNAVKKRKSLYGKSNVCVILNCKYIKITILLS